MIDIEEPPIRTKSRRTRIKESRAKRHRRRFYWISGTINSPQRGKQLRARK